MLVAAGSDLFVGDWKNTPADLVAQIRTTVCPVVLIGGFTGEAVADLHVRQGFAETDPDPQRPQLSGADWLLLDDAYAGLPAKQIAQPAANILVSLGGTATDLVDRIENSIRQSPALSGLELNVRRPGGTRDGRTLLPLHDALLNADLAVLAGGTTLHEAAATGLPALCVPIVPHQYDRARQFQRLGLGLMIDPEKPCFERRVTETMEALATDAERRVRMARRGQTLVDGRGADRLARHLIEFPLSQQGASQ
nr:glycosyltransferase [Maricaulis parjimensis]